MQLFGKMLVLYLKLSISESPNRKEDRNETNELVFGNNTCHNFGDST